MGRAPKCGERDGALFLEVTDQRPGVPAEFVPRLFDRFTRADPPVGGRAGSGFGLYTVGRLAEANG